jgi:hypothetical protein
MAHRFKDAGESIYSFGDEFLVQCPRCHRCARVTVVPGQKSGLFAPRRLVCACCGSTKDWHERTVCIGDGPTDWYFRLPLWLQTSCCGQTFWAYNGEHLDFLQRYVQADLRERLPNKNSSLASRLPAWMKDAKHRDEVLRGIEALRKKLREV